MKQNCQLLNKMSKNFFQRVSLFNLFNFNLIFNYLLSDVQISICYS